MLGELLQVHVPELNVEVDQVVVWMEQKEEVLEQEFVDESIGVLVLKQVSLGHQELDSVLVLENAEKDVEWGNDHANPQVESHFWVQFGKPNFVLSFLDQYANQHLQHDQRENRQREHLVCTVEELVRLGVA